jgi:hypothetical protein
MRIRFGRAQGLAGFAGAVGLTGAVVGVLLASGAAAPAIAGTTDSGGTGRVVVRQGYVAALAKSGIVILPGSTGTATEVKQGEQITLQVSGGDATFIGTIGTLDFAGTLQLTDGATGKSVTLGDPELNYGTMYLADKDGTRSVVLGQLGGALNGTASAGPPATQTVTASAIYLTYGGASFLDSALHTTFFKPGQDLGSFAATYDVATAS